MKYSKMDLTSISFLIFKMAIIATFIEAMGSFIYGDFAIDDLLLAFLIYCVGLSFIYGCALILPPKTKYNPLTLGNDILESIYPEAIGDLYVDDEKRGVFKVNTMKIDGVSCREFEPIENAFELFVMLNTYQKVLVTIQTNRSKEIYTHLELYKENAKFMIEHPGVTKAFSKS
ncbi:hypothetical protein [Paenibacillus methanolicus]|uniref:Uncharacterized protein n=1 Tax=Paenibacillus methanolicus TaxID=582686 RepID=A0A5S5C1F7_9BACL|nr:hypothetical protein [Paenibacillus methanolicus]TYP73265.1 hypothetical protein BCM02_107249 [Paenibacillus methanolicus]